MIALYLIVILMPLLGGIALSLLKKSPKKVPSCIFFEKKKYAKMTLWAIWPDQ